ncbi:hypothetical protein LDENG_00187000 [Lucifuga dentata]|nr:hypothetical protein LDENG_00187000 [Lucifuga dentata]
MVMMAASLWLCLFVPLAVTEARSVGQHDEPLPNVRLEPFWTGRQLRIRSHTNIPQKNHALPVVLVPHIEPEVLDLDQHRRHARGTEEEEQQSTFSHSYENDSMTSPAFHNVTKSVSDGGNNNKDDNNHHGSNSDPDHGAPRLFNPFYLMAEGSYAAYTILFLASLVLAVGVVGNMAVMCVVWNNYYMRSAWNYLLASMAFWDFLVLVVCLPVVVLNQLSHRRILGDITCRLVPYMEVASLGITSFTLPEIFLWQLSHTDSASSTPTTADICSITASSPLTLYLPDSLHSLLLRYHQGRVWWCFGCYFCLPVLFTVLCQLATRNVSSDASSTKKQRNHDDHSSNQKQQHQAVERKLNCTLLALAVVYSVCALPEHVCNITLAYTHITVSEDTAAMLALLHHFLLFFKSSVTPVLLLCLCKALGQAFMDCCCCCCQECQPITAHPSPGSAHVTLKPANETSIFFDKAKDTSAILSISS